MNAETDPPVPDVPPSVTAGPEAIGRAFRSSPRVGGVAPRAFAVRAILRFAAFALIALFLAVIFVNRSGGSRGRGLAVQEAGRVSFLLAHSAVEPESVALRELRSPDSSIRDAAVSRLEQVATRVRALGSIQSMRVWRPDGSLAYTDDATLTAATPRLSPQDLTVLTTPGGRTELLDRAPVPGARSDGSVVRSLQPIGDDDVYIVETLSGSEIIRSAADRSWRQYAAMVAAVLTALTLVQLPLVWGAISRLRRHHDEREGILLDLLGTVEDERRRVAYTVRQDILAELATTTGRIDIAGHLSDQTGDPATAGRIAEIGRAVDRTARSLEVLADDLHPVALMRLGLERALVELVDEARHIGIDVRSSVTVDAHDVPEDVALLVSAPPARHCATSWSTAGPATST